MTRKISCRDLRDECTAIVWAAERGETFVITQDGTPVAELGPLRRRTFVSVEEICRTAGYLPQIDYQAMRAELDELIDQDPFRD